jgi:AcrR family transcriptional regulator
MHDKGNGSSQQTISAALERKRLRERKRTMRLMLELSGELGYRRATLAELRARGGEEIGQFRSHFKSREQCFAEAHDAELERLYSALSTAALAPESLRDGLRAALVVLFRYAIEQPSIATAVFREVYVVGGTALNKHEELLERLSRAIDGACRASLEVSHAPPPLAASFMVGGIEEFMCAQLAKGDPQGLLRALPELMHLLVAPYFGDEAAREELSREPPLGGSDRH